MAQILAIDYGKARCGIAATDDFQIIASGLDTVETKNIFVFLKKHFNENIFLLFFKKSLEKINGFCSPDGSKYPFL